MAPPREIPRQDFHILPIHVPPTPLAPRALLSENGPDTTNTIFIAAASILGAATLLFLIALIVYRRRLERHRMIESQFVAVQRKNDHFNHDTAPNSPVPSGAADGEGEEGEKRLSTIQEEGPGGKGCTYRATKDARSSEGALPVMPTTVDELRKWGQDARRVLSAEETPDRGSTDIGLEVMSGMRRDEHSPQGRSLTKPAIGTAISC